MAYVHRSNAAEKTRRFQTVEQKRKELHARCQELAHFAKSFELDFENKRSETQKAYERLMRLDQERAVELRKLEKRRNANCN